MKKIITYIIYILTVGLIASGCGKKFLEIEPTGQYFASTFYKTNADAISGVNYAYAPLKLNGLYKMRIGMLDLLTDNCIVSYDGYADGLEWYEIKEGRQNPGNGMVGEVWEACYIGISRANMVIKNVGDAPVSPNLDETVKKYAVGQTLFLRALYYFNLVRLYGDVPLVLAPTENLGEDAYPPRKPLAEVYKQIITDLKTAADNLPDTWDTPNLGRATKGSAYGLLAKVYLTLATRNYGSKYTKAGDEYQNVISYCEKVFQSPAGYGLMPYYGDFFNPDKSGENCKESLFEVQMDNSDYNMGGRQAIFYGPRFFKTSPGGWGFGAPTREFVANYEAGDQRLPASIFRQGDSWRDGSYIYDTTDVTTRTGYNIRKYLCFWEDDPWERSPINIHVVRLADAYLMYAEAKLATGSPAVAAEYVNKVRRRAGLPDLASVNFDRIFNERRMELAFENDRYFDLLRTDRLIPVMATQVKGDFVPGNNIQLTAKNMFWPIPQGEINKNHNLTQNDGY